MMETTTKHTILRLVPTAGKPRAPRKGPGEWRSISRSHRIKDGRPVILHVPKVCAGEPFIGEAYWSVEGRAWRLANTEPGDAGAPSVRDTFGCEPDMWHPLPSKPPEPPKKQAVSGRGRTTSKLRGKRAN